MIGAWQRKKHALFPLISSNRNTRVIFSFAVFAVNCRYHVHRYCYINSMEPLQTYLRWCILCLRAWNAKTECESTLIQTVKDEFYRETDLFGSDPEEKLLWTTINPRALSYTNRKCRKWSIWRILLICLTSQLKHKSTICIFRHLP